jgi:non-specific serine/threonine protein kinase
MPARIHHLFQHTTYPSTPHGFLELGVRADTSADAWRRALEFFTRNGNSASSCTSRTDICRRGPAHWMLKLRSSAPKLKWLSRTDLRDVVSEVTDLSERKAGNLPDDVTSFVGRRQATAEIKRALSTSRLVTLSGAGGVGKSRLALHVARGLRRAFPDGAWLVELAKLDDASLVGNAVAAALELPDTFSARDLESVLVDYLADKRLLLVLDNCEHLLEACIHLVSALLLAAPNLRVLATSRELLGIGGETVWPVPPLSVPDVVASSAADLPAHQFEASALFEDRASAVSPGFTLNHDNAKAVAQLCQRLDGLPLAIELAAVWLRALSVDQVLARLVDRDELLSTDKRAALPRHQTLRATVEWSFDLCTKLERTLWARVSVFTGDFDLEAAEHVCASDGLAAEDVFTGVAGLLDKSVLARHGNNPRTRYRMLDTIRQYGRERLAENGDEVAVRRRHRDYYLWLAEQAEADWFGPRQVEWLNNFHTEQPNVWVAMDFCLTEPGEARTGMRMAGALWWYWIGRALRDGRHWLDRALTVETEPSHERAKALWVDGWIAVSQGDTPPALPVLDECAAMARRLGDEAALACAMHFIGVAKWVQNLAPDAVAFLEEALDRHRAADAPRSLTALALCHLAMAVALLGDVERAVALCEECTADCEAHGECWTRSWAQWDLVVIRWRQGDVPKASEHARQSLRLKQILNDQLGIPFCVEFLAWVAVVDGDAERAALLFGMSEKMWEPIGGGRLSETKALLDSSDQCRTQAREILGEQAFAAASQRGREFAVDAAIAYALGEKPRAPHAAAVPDAAPLLPHLTRREREVAELVAEGQSNSQIAANLVISQRTAESHIEHILSKLGFNSRTQIAVWFIEQQEK